MDSRILFVVVGLFALGAVVVALLQRLAGPERAPQQLWRLYALQVLIVAVILLPARCGGLLWLTTLILLAWRAQYELIELQGLSVRTPRALAALALGTLAVLAAGLAGPATAVLAIGLGAALLLAAPGAGRSVAASLLIPGAAIAHLALYGGLEHGFAWLALVYILVEVNDTAAYLFGRAFGRRRVLPRLSPNKTWVGLAAGLAAALLAGLALNAWVFGLDWGWAALVVLVIVAGGLAGDLFTSALKRRAGRKDFAPVLVAHGGVLDIYDSLLFAAPGFLVLHQLLLR